MSQSLINLFVSPCDGDDEKESPSPMEKGERTRLRVGGLTPDVQPHHHCADAQRSPAPFRGGQNLERIFCPYDDTAAGHGIAVLAVQMIHSTLFGVSSVR